LQLCSEFFFFAASFDSKPVSTNTSDKWNGWRKHAELSQLNLEEVKCYRGRGNHKGNLHIQCKWSMLPRISGGRTPCFQLGQFSTGSIECTVPSEGTTAKLSFNSSAPQLVYHINSVIQDRGYLQRCAVSHTLPTWKLIFVQSVGFALLLWWLSQVEWGVAEVRLNMTLYFMVQAHPRIVATHTLTEQNYCVVPWGHAWRDLH